MASRPSQANPRDTAVASTKVALRIGSPSLERDRSHSEERSPIRHPGNSPSAVCRSNRDAPTHSAADAPVPHAVSCARYATPGQEMNALTNQLLTPPIGAFLFGVG